MADVIALSEILRVSVINIVRMVLDGDLKAIELLSANLKFRSVLVNPDEILDVVEKRNLAGEGLIRSIWLPDTQIRNHANSNGHPKRAAVLPFSVDIDRDPREGLAASWPIKLRLLGGYRRRFVVREVLNIEFIE